MLLMKNLLVLSENNLHCGSCNCHAHRRRPTKERLPLAAHPLVVDLQLAVHGLGGLRAASRRRRESRPAVVAVHASVLAVVAVD